MKTKSLNSGKSYAAILLLAMVALNACAESVAQESLFARQLLTVDTFLDGGFHVELLHREHHASPLRSQQPIKLSQRYIEAAKRSRERQTSMKNVPQFSSADIITNSTHGDHSATSPTFSQKQEYLMSITLGTPARTFTTIVDTGSDLVWVQCSPCPQCFAQPDALFDPSKSSTYETIFCNNTLCEVEFDAVSCSSGCEYSFSYADGTTTEGILSSETLTITSVSGKKSLVPNFAFGCGSNDSGNYAGSDGLVGLGRGTLSMLTQLAPTIGNKFSYCLVTFTDVITKSSPLIMGNAARPANVSGIQFTQLIQSPINPSFYYVGIESISVNGKKLDIPASAFELDSQGGGGTIVDSGTTLYFLEKTAYDPLEKALKALIDYPTVIDPPPGYDLCYNVSGVHEPVFPVMTLHFNGGADYVFPQLNTFAPIDHEVETTCLTVVPSIGNSILGNLQQQNFFILFDLENQQFGFKPQQCDQGL